MKDSDEGLQGAVEIEPGIWQGSSVAVTDLLTRCNSELRLWAVVTASLCHCKYPVREHLRLNLRDSTEQPLVDELLESVFQFVNKARDEGLNVLIHCEAGISRSAAIACYWLMKSRAWTAEKSLSHLRESGNSRANPNAGFWKKLQSLNQQHSVTTKEQNRDQ